jgi:sec-independent protein translocase protein TatA
MGLPGLESPVHLLILLVVVLLLFGAKRLPELGKSLGKGINEFKEGLNSKNEPAEEERPKEALEGERAKADPAAGDEPRNEETAHAKDPQSSKQR